MPKPMRAGGKQNKNEEKKQKKQRTMAWPTLPNYQLHELQSDVAERERERERWRETLELLKEREDERD